METQTRLCVSEFVSACEKDIYNFKIYNTTNPEKHAFMESNIKLRNLFVEYYE